MPKNDSWLDIFPSAKVEDEKSKVDKPLSNERKTGVFRLRQERYLKLRGKNKVTDKK